MAFIGYISPKLTTKFYFVSNIYNFHIKPSILKILTLMQRLETEYAEFWIENGILFFIYKKGVEITLDVAKKIVSDRIRFQNGVLYPVFCDIRGIKGSEKAGRDYIANEGSELVKAVGALVESPVTKVMINLYLTVTKPKTPTRMFTDQKSALTYLEEFKVPVAVK